VNPPGAGFAAQAVAPRLLLTGEIDPPANAPQRAARQAQAQAQAQLGAKAEDVRFANLPAAEPFPALVKAPRAASPRGVLRGPGTPPEDAERRDVFAPVNIPNRRPGSGRSQRPGSRGTPPGMRPGSGDPRSARELEERVAVAESQAAAQAARVRNLERRLAVAEAARKEDDIGARGSTDALERRVDALTQMYARSESLAAEMRGRLEAAESDARESRAQATRAESVAQNLVVGARDNMEQIGNRISVEQSSDAKRLDTLSAEIARLTREVADARGDDLSKRQLMEADIARLSGQKASENAVAQIGDVRAKLNATEELARSLAEQLAIEKAGRAESESRFESIVQRLEETSSAREQALLRKFEHELNDRVTELQRKVVDESEEAALRDQDIIREKDDQMASFEQGTKRERQKTVEHQMVLEKAIREEHEARVAQAATLTKALDRVNHDVVALVEDERLARETKESKLRGQITQTLAKLHDANRDTNERLETEAHAVRSVVKAEIEARVTAMDAVHKALERGTTGMERQLAAGRVEAAQAVRTAEVKLSRRLAATEGRVEVEVAALRKLYARQTALELDLDAFKRDVVNAFEQMQEEITVAAVAQALNTEADNVQAEYVTDAVQSLVDKIAAQDKRDSAAAEALQQAVFGPTSSGEPGLVPRADRAERKLGEAFNALSVFERELGVVRETATEDKADLESQVALLQQEMDYNAAATLVETETLQTQVDVAMGEVAGAGEMIEGKLRVTAEDLAKRNVARMEEIRTELWVPLSSLRAAIDAEAVAREKTDEDVKAHAKARDDAVGALWGAVEQHYVAQNLETEAVRLDAEEFAIARVGAFEDALEAEKKKRAEALDTLKQHVVAVVEEEAENRRRGDDETRRAYEDDIANLEDTAAEAVRELREGLRDEVAERTHQAETLHRDLSSTLASARSRLEQDVRALEETAAGNIATQKLEEEMLRAEVDDGLAQMQDAVEEMRAEVGRHCETIAAAAGGAAEPVTRRVEVLEASLAGAAHADEVEKAFRQVHADVAKVEAEVAGAAAARLAENEAYRTEFEQSLFAEAAARERSMRELSSRFDADIEDAKQEAGVDVTVAAEALRAELEAELRETAAKCAGALDEEAAERKSGDASVGAKIAEAVGAVDASVGAKIAEAVGAVAEELRRSVLELAADLTTESETLRAHCEAHAAQAVAALQSTVTEGLGLNAEALEELRGDVAAAVEKVEGLEAGGGGAGGGGEEDAKSVHSDISEAKEKLSEMQREIEAVKAHAEQQVAELLAKSQEDLKAEMSKGNEATAAMLEKIMAKLGAE
jgi:hypothetical protein